MSRTKNIIGVNASHASTIQNHDWMNAALQLLAEKPKKPKIVSLQRASLNYLMPILLGWATPSEVV